MKPQLTSLHEISHAVAAAICAAGVPGGSGADVTAYISLDPEHVAGEGICRLKISERLRVTPEYLGAWSACGPLGGLLSPRDIGLAIAEGRQSEMLSEPDCESAEAITVMDQFVAAVATHKWRGLIGSTRLMELHDALVDWRVLFHDPLPIPACTFCPDLLARRLRLEALREMPHYLPAKATFGVVTSNRHAA